VQISRPSNRRPALNWGFGENHAKMAEKHAIMASADVSNEHYEAALKNLRISTVGASSVLSNYGYDPLATAMDQPIYSLVTKTIFVIHQED